SPHAPTVTAKSAAVSIGTRKGRGCTLVLTVAGALAAATTAAFFLGLLPGTGGDEGRSGGNAASPGASAASAGPARPSTVLKDFSGTWTGQAVQSDGTPNGTMTSVITDDPNAPYAVRTTYDVLGVIQCHSKARLTSATTGRITLEESTDGTPGAGCTGQTSAVTYTLAPDGGLAFSSDDVKGGKVKATLTRSGG
ncbi:serine/threonine protein kinase, partial [Streptomyces sp. UNOB3_S3]|nr:serine/threonine protein kinase [Streptomyces sp. UNOB3_S3]